jgi:hypothetical protein
MARVIGRTEGEWEGARRWGGRREINQEKTGSRR